MTPPDPRDGDLRGRRSTGGHPLAAQAPCGHGPAPPGGDQPAEGDPSPGRGGALRPPTQRIDPGRETAHGNSSRPGEGDLHHALRHVDPGPRPLGAGYVSDAPAGRGRHGAKSPLPSACASSTSRPASAGLSSARAGRSSPADYKLVCHLPNGRSAYTFCVCPGGQIVAAASPARRRRDQWHEQPGAGRQVHQRRLSGGRRPWGFRQ
ncbi:MAG: FAD-dependent protein [Evtepia sp.]